MPLLIGQLRPSAVDLLQDRRQAIMYHGGGAFFARHLGQGIRM
ncbi:hypothetical protein [Reyranella sp.]